MSTKSNLSELIAHHMAGSAISINLPRTASSFAGATEKASTPIVASNASQTTVGRSSDEDATDATDAAERPTDHGFASALEQSSTDPSATGEQLGTTLVSELSPEHYQIFEEEFNLSRESIKSAGIRAVHYIPSAGERVATFFHHDRRECVQCSWDEQWQPRFESFSYVYLPPIPEGNSLRAPVLNKSKQVVGYIYYRLRPRAGGSGHQIQMYRPTHATRLIDFGFSDTFSVDPTGLIVVDNIFQSLNLQRMGFPSVSVNGILSHGFSAEGYFPFDPTIEKRGDTWKPRDAEALAELLPLRDLMEDGNYVMVLCERDWLIQEDFKKSSFFLQQMIDLCKVIADQDNNVTVLTPFHSSRKDESFDLDHNLATDWFADDFGSSDHHMVVASDRFSDARDADDHPIVEMCALTS